LPFWSQAFWDKKIKWFDNRRKSFYFRGTAGAFARAMKVYTDRVIRVRPHLEDLMAAETLEQQQAIYERHLERKFWSGVVKFTLNRDTTMSLLGVPKAQRKQIDTQYRGGLLQFMQDCLRAVFVEIPMKDNYFWQLYMNGRYARNCCPEYLTESGFSDLKNGLVDRVSTHTNSVQGFLDGHGQSISRFVLLDHMDWLSDRFFPLLESEWQAICNRAAAGARIIWRSGGLQTDFIDQVYVRHHGELVRVSSLLNYNRELANRLHRQDRVHTYGSFYIADLAV
jgi:S-adenosylmethionine-diacylglycerol 3-amino-3-carboxypropyl transferase